MLSYAVLGVATLCDKNVRCIKISFSDNLNLRQLHEATIVTILMPAVLPIGVEIQGAGIRAFFPVPDKMVVRLIVRFMVFVIREILGVQVTILYPVMVYFLVFDRIIQIVFAKYQLVI
jgi:hypothetical protein